MNERRRFHAENQMMYQATTDYREEPSTQCAHFIQQVESEYRFKTSDMGISVPSTPLNLEQIIMRYANNLPSIPSALQRNLRDKVPEDFLTMIDVCGKLSAGKDPLLIFGHTWIDIRGERSSWSTSKQLANATKEALKPVFVEKGSLVMRECAKHLGEEFVDFVRSAFMSELTGFLIEYLADQVFTYFAGGGGAGSSFDFYTFLEELILFLLRYFIVLLLCCIHPNMMYLKNFLDTIVPIFLKFIISKLR